MNIIEGFRNVCPKSTLIIQIIGAIIVLRKIYSILNLLWKMIRKRKNLKQRYGAGSWAFITGSSDGIGKALAFSYAKQGFNVILSARTVSKMEALQKQITQKYPGRQVKILPADYKKAIDYEYVRGLLDQIADLDISIVVNNVGVDVCDKYTDLQPSKIQQLISINCFPVAFINRYFIPILQKRTQTKKLKCAIVNVASIAGVSPMPYLQVYAASKAYIDRLSLSLNYEYPQLDIISIRPGEVSTPMTMNKQLDIFTIKAETCAEGILDQMGQDVASAGPWRHQFQLYLLQMVPQRFFNYFFTKFMLPGELKRRKGQ